MDYRRLNDCFDKFKHCPWAATFKTVASECLFFGGVFFFFGISAHLRHSVQSASNSDSVQQTDNWGLGLSEFLKEDGCNWKKKFLGCFWWLMGVGNPAEIRI